MQPSTIRGIAAIYTLLALILIGSGLGAYAAYTSHGTTARVAHIEGQLGDQNIDRIAEKYIAQAAQAQGLAVKQIRVVSTKVVGDTATVVASVTVTDGLSDQTVKLRVTVVRGIWQPTNLEAA